MWLSTLGEAVPSIKTSIFIDKNSTKELENTPVTGISDRNNEVSPSALNKRMPSKAGEYLIQEALKESVPNMIWKLEETPNPKQ